MFLRPRAAHQVLAIFPVTQDTLCTAQGKGGEIVKLGAAWDAAPELREESGFSSEPEESVTSGRASNASPKSPETLVSKVLFGCPHLFSFLPYLKAESGETFQAAFLS